MIHRISAGALVGPRGVLLTHRSRQRRYYPDCWDFPGGHIEPGENAADALRRELREEIDVVAEISGEPRLRITEEDPNGDVMDLRLWVIDSWLGEARNVATDEHDEIRWISRAEVPTLQLAHPDYADLLAELTACGGAAR